MMRANVGQSYRSMETLSSSPDKLVSALYARLLRDLRRARRHIEEGRAEEARDELQHGNEVLIELIACLDFEQGGEIAQSLVRHYRHYLKEVTMVSGTLDSDRLAPVIEGIEKLSEAWSKASAIARVGGS